MATETEEVGSGLGGGKTPPRRTIRNLRDLNSILDSVDSISAPATYPSGQAAPNTSQNTDPIVQNNVNLPSLYMDSAAAVSNDEQIQPVPEPGEKTTPNSASPETTPDQIGQPSRPAARTRRLPDLSALYDSDPPAPKPAAETPPTPRPQRLPDLSSLDETSSDPPAPRPRKRPDLSALYDDIQPLTVPPAGPNPGGSLPISAQPTLADEDGEDSAAGLVISPALQRYISADLWRRLNSANPPRGLLINALDRVRSVLNLLSTFLPNHLVQEKMRRPVAGLVSGQMLTGTLLFSDVSGFTALSERLQGSGPKGAERLTSIMNRYFALMIEIISWSGGTLLKFAGDAILVYFPEQPHQAQANWAVRAGQRMLRAIATFGNEIEDSENIPGGISLKMKIGLATGEYLAASLGSEKRMEYVVLGPAVAQTLAAEGASTAAGQLVIDPATRAALEASVAVSDHKAGFSLVGAAHDKDLDDFEIRAETRRARGAIPWSASPHALMAQAEVALRQIDAILPYLPPEVSEQVVVHGQRAQFASQFRPTTVIFCNFWGYEQLMAAWGGAGVQRLTSLLNAYFTAMNDVITRYGGIISRIDPYSRGTKMLILFGAPVAHEDDPQRAASAALSMNAELETLNDGWRRKFARHLPPGQNGPLIQHRIGITTGATFAGQVGSPTRREYTVMGDDVNLSARLMAAAEPGQILASLPPDVREVLADYFYLSPLPPIRVKGKSKAISLYQVQAPREDQLGARAHKRGQLIGRRQELARGEALLQAVLGGQCRLLLLTGPAGIGKSHLADELLLRAEAHGARVLFTPCRSFSAASPYAGWSGLLRSLAGITSSDFLPEVHQQKLHQMVHSLELPKRLIHSLATLMGLKSAPRDNGAGAGDGSGDDLLAQARLGRGRRRASALDVWDQLEPVETTESGQVWHAIPAQLSGVERETVYSAVAELLRGAAKAMPLVIFFEDAHWMDPQTHDLLQYVVQHAGSLPLLFLLALRGEPAPATADIGQVINLAPLSPLETAEFVAHLLVSDLAPVIHEQASGNPLYVEEITRWFRRTRNINAGELRSVLQTSNVLQKLVLSGLENLPKEQQEVALVAAVIGHEFRTGEVQALLPPEIDPVTLSLHLRGLVRARLVVLAEAGADARYAFQQTLVRDVLYQSLPFERRKELHRRLGDYLSKPTSQRRALHARLSAALEAGSDTNPAAATERIASQYELGEAWLAAARSLAQAASQSSQRGDYAGASTSYARALSDLDRVPVEHDPGERAALKLQLLTGQGDAALRAGDYLNAVSAYETASAAAPAAAMLAETPDLNAPLSLAFRLALALAQVKRAEEAEAQLRRALQAAPEPTPEALLALAWLAVRTARSDATERIVTARTAQLGQNDRGLALLSDLAGEWEAAAQAYQALALPLEAGWLALRAGDAALAQNNLAAAEDWYQRATAALPHNNAPAALLRALAAYRLAECAFRTGQTEQARAALESARAALAGAPPDLAAEGQQAVQQALKGLAAARGRRTWPAWRALAFEDHLRLGLIFPAEHNTL